MICDWLLLCSCKRTHVWFFSLIWKQLTPLSHSNGHILNQTKSLPLFLFVCVCLLTSNKTVPSLISQFSFAIISIIHSFPFICIFFSFFYSTLVRFLKLFENITPNTPVQPFLLLSETCLYKVNLPLTKGCPSASGGVLEKCFEKCVERIKVRPRARTSSFYRILVFWAAKHRQTDTYRPAPPFRYIPLHKT